MKRAVLAAAVAALSLVGWSADVCDYVQKGLVAQWDGVRNQGAGLAHSADATTWVDCIGGRTFELTDVTIGENCLQFSGLATSYGVLDAAGTQAVFEKYGPTGTIEYVFLFEGSDNAILLKSTQTSGVALGWTTVTIFSSVANGPYSSVAGPQTYKNTFTSMAVAYSKVANPRGFFVNGEAKALGDGKNWSGTPTCTYIGRRGSASEYPFKGKLYAIRVYDHNLTPEEVTQNYAVDVERFVNGDAGGSSDKLTIDGYPEAYGEVSPVYGITNGLAAGDGFVCSAPSEVLAPGGACEAICTGYVLYTRGTAVGDDWAEAGHDSVTSFTYVHPEGVESKLVWKWKTALDIDPRLAIASSAVGSCEIAATVKGIGLAATSATLTFSYGTASNALDHTVEMTVTEACERRLALARLQPGTNLYVKATLSNDDGESAESELLSVEQSAGDDRLLPFGYVKIEYVESSGSQYVNTGVRGRDGLEVRTKMMWMSVPSDGGYLAAKGSNSVRAYPIYCFPSRWDYGYSVNCNDTALPLIPNVLYDVYSILAPGDQRLVVSGMTALRGTDAQSIDAGIPLYLFALNNSGSAGNHSSARCYSLQIWERGELTRDYVPCYSKADSAYGLYDFKNRTFSKSGNANALLGPDVSADDRGIRIAFTGAKSVTLAIEKSASASTLYRVNGSTYGGEDAAAWDSVTEIGPVDASDADIEQLASFGEEWGADAYLARFFLVTGTTTNWSGTTVWQPAPPIAMEKKLSLDSSAFGSSKIAATVTSIGETASEATLTFHYGTASNALDGTVEVPVADAGVWRATIPHCIAGKTYYVKATLENDDGESVESDVFDFVQPEVKEPGDASSASYQKDGLVGQWDGIDNVIVGGRRMHSDTPDKWYDLSGNGYDGTFANPTTLTWHENCWKNETSTTVPVTVPATLSARIANKVYTVEFLVEPSQGTTRFCYFSQWNKTKGFGLEQTASGQLRVGYFQGLPLQQDWNSGTPSIPKDEVTHVAVTASNGVHVVYLNGVKAWTDTGDANLATGSDIPVAIGGEIANRANMAFLGKWYTCRAYDRALSADEVAENYRIDRRRFVEGVRESQPLELQNGQLVTKIPLSASVQKVFFYAGATYGGVDGWGDPVAVSNVAAGVTSVSFPKPTGWGSSVWFARVRIGEGDDAAWSNTLIAEPPAPLGMSETLSLASSAVGSSDIAATVTGIGKTASVATLTFGYGTTSDCADGSVELSVTDAGEWRGTIPHLAAGKTYYVKATLENDDGESVESDVLPVVQPEVREDGVDPRLRADLPAGYRQMVKLTSTGAQRIPTKIVPTSTTTVEFEFGECKDASTTTLIFGQEWNDPRYMLDTQGGNNRNFFFHGNSKDASVTCNLGMPINAAHDYRFTTTLRAGEAGYADARIQDVTADPATETTTKVDLGLAANKVWYFFGAPARTDRYSHYSFYSFKSWDGDALTGDFVPVLRLSDNTAGLYDFVSKDFYTTELATAFAPQAFEQCASLELQNGQLVATVQVSDTARTAVFYWGETYGGTDDWASSASVEIPAGATTVEFDLPDGWGSSVWFARAKIGEGDGAVWSKTLVAADATLPSVTLGELDGLGGDTIVVKGTVESLGGTSCTLTAYVGPDENSLTNVWANVDGSILTETGDFTLKLFENDTTAPRYLVPGETYFVRIVATSSNGKVAWSSVKSVAMASEAAFKSQSVAVSGHTMTVTASMSGLGMTGATVVELWVGESASSLKKVNSIPVTSVGTSFDLTATLEEFEKDYFWQLKAVNTSEGGTSSTTIETATATKSAPDTATYTWTGAGTDNRWANRDNWSDNKGGDCLGYPQSANATAVFNKNADVEIDLPRNGTTANVGSLNLNTADIAVRFSSENTNDFGIVTSSLSLPGARSHWTLDGSYVCNNGGQIDMRVDSVIELKNAANLYTGNLYSGAAANTKIVLSGDSWMSVGVLYMGNGHSLLQIEDSTFCTRGYAYFNWNKKSENEVRFMGAHPLWLHDTTSGFSAQTSDPLNSVHFDFLVPVDGYAAAPIRMLRTNGAVMGGTDEITVNVLPESPIARVDGDYEIPLISWAKGINKTWVVEGSLPVEVPGAAFIWSEEGSPLSLSARFSGSAHTDRLTVTGAPEELVGGAISPGYGNQDGQTSRTLTAPAEPTTYDNGTRRATCLGWKLYDVDPATQTAGATPVESGTENTYAWTSENKWQKFVWQWKREVSVSATAGTGGSVEPAAGWAAEDTAYTVTATPESGYRFYKWTGDVPQQKMFNATLSDIFRKPSALSAVFVSDGELTEAAAAQSGDWSAAETWGGAVPGAGSKVVISNVTVSVSAADALLVGAIEVKDGGVLRIWGADADATKPDPKTVVPLTGIAAGSDLLLDVVGDFTVDGSSWVSVGGRNADYRVFVNVGGNLTLGESAKFAVYGGAVEPDPDDVEKYMGDGAAVNVGSNLTTAAGAWVYPFAHGVKGSNVRFSVGGDVEIAAGGGFDADGKGYQYPNGPGFHWTSGWSEGHGGSYGGLALWSNYAKAEGVTYGFAYAPFMVGSPGRQGGGPTVVENGNGETGGGGIRIHAGGDVTLNGTLTANSEMGRLTSGAGSGGGIWITCTAFNVGEAAVIRAVGDNSSYGLSGPGSGGRIAIATGGVGDALLDELYATGSCSDLIVIAADATDPSQCDYSSHFNVSGGSHGTYVAESGSAVVMANPGASRPIKVSVDPAFDVYESIELSPLSGMTLLEGETTATASGTNFVAGTDQRERRILTEHVYANENGTLHTGPESSCTINSADGASLFLTWKFARLEKLLRIAYDPTRGSIANLDNEGWYVDGTTATVTAVPAEGWRFLAWTGEVAVEDSGNNPLSLAMDVPHDVEAVFVPSATAETLSATQGGEWFDAATWGGAAVPDENTDVVIDGQTVYLPSVVNVQAKSITVRNGGKLRLWGLGNDLLKITPMVTTCEGTLTATIGGDVTVEGNGSWISVGGRNSGYTIDLTIGGNLTLGENGKFAVYGGAVEPDAKDVEKYVGDGAKVTVAGNLTTAAGAWVYPFAHGVKGSNVRFTVGGDVEIAAGGGFDADGKGYQNPNGPGYFYYAGNGDGGSYGGVGGTGAHESGRDRTYGFDYGYAFAPFMVGSSGNPGGSGGGAIRLHVAGDVTLDGTLTADGMVTGDAAKINSSGCGAGGGIWVTCKNFTPGDAALVSAVGASGNNGTDTGGTSGFIRGGGGGGRVAILTGGCDDEMLSEFYATGESTNENLRVVTTNVNDSAEYAYPNLIDIHGGYSAWRIAYGTKGTGAILLNLGNSRPITVSVEPAAGTMEGLVVSPAVGLTTIEGEVTATVTATNFVTGTDQRERRILTEHVYANENETLHAGPEASCAVNSADGNELTLAWTFGRLEKLIRVTADASCGTVTGIENGGWYLDGTTATVTAHPAEGWRFLAWTGDVPKRCATENPISLAMNVPRDVKAVFVLEESPAALTATKSGDWFEAETWGGAGVPGADTAVTIESNKNLTVEVTLPMDVSVKSITLAGQGMLRLWGVDATATPNPTTVNPLGADKVDPSFTGELKLTVAESVTIGGNAWMSVGGKGSNYRPQVAVGRDLALDGTAAGFSVYAGPVSTNDLVTYAKGSCRMNVARNITLADKAIVYPFNHPTNGAAVVFSAQNVTVGTNAAFKAERAGYNYCYGPSACYAHHLSGAGGEGNGASYGGRHSKYVLAYPTQPTYGNAYAPFWAGSPGTYQSDGGLPGGGAIILEVSRQLTLYGRLDADASADSVSAGLGSGGSVWVKAKRITIDAGSAKITAKGGSNVWGGAGASGGGRICIVERVPSETQFAEAVNLGDRDDFPRLKGFDVLCTNLTDAATLTAAGFDEAYTNVFSALPGGFSTNSAYYPQSLPTPGTAVWLRAKPAGTVIIVR